jgi:hypothetical protein
MANPVIALKHMSIPPTEEASFNTWLQLEDAIAFLKDNTRDDQFVLYASLPNVFIHAMLVPSEYVTPPNINDLMLWNCNPYQLGWGVVTSYHPTPSIAISPPLDGTGSETLDKGEQLIFAREFEGRVGEKHYFEILQKFLHISGLHYLEERNAHCRLDRHGDVEEVVSIIKIPAVDGQMSGGTIITVTREVLDRYVTLTDSAIVRTFDFTRTSLSRFGGWSGSQNATVTEMGDLFFRIHIETGNASYIRGCQVIPSQTSKEDIIEEFHPGSKKNAQYASFIALDWKNQVVKEISCAPGATANYFTQSDLPFEVSPAFFRPEVLSKYKADSEKYRLDERAILCRGTWYLKNYDVNEAGQVHTYLVYLRNLPYEEQLHWKAHNEAPKGTISRRAFLSDFEGCWEHPYDPLESVKEHVRKLKDRQSPWWTLSSEDAIDRSHYPITASPDEWANEILHLDQLIVEPFEKAWFKSELLQLGKTPDPNAGSLVLTEECLTRWGQDPDEAKRIVSPLRTLHELRSKLKGHAVGKSTLTQLRQQALNEHGSYKEHFRVLCRLCDESLRKITEIIAAQRASTNSQDKQ